MKKINQYLLTNYPTIWNTKAHIIIPILLVIHALYFLLAYSQPVSLNDISNISFYPDEGLFSFSILLSGIMLIIWLVYYFRNNALKNLYPKSWPSLAGEFFIVLITSFLICGILFSFQKGATLKYNSFFNKANIHIVDEVNTTNIALAFLPEDFDSYHYSRSCNYNGDNGTVDNDSLDNMRNSNSNVSGSFSYLNYCRLGINLDYRKDNPKIYSQEDVHIIVNRWLLSNNKDSVKSVIVNYLKLVTKYGGSYQIDVDKQVDDIFSTKDFVVTNTIASSESNNDNLFIDRYYVNNALSTMYRRTDNNYEYNFTRYTGMVYWYIAFSIAILIFSFKLFTLRTWVISLISAGLLSLIFIMLGVVTRGAEGVATFYIVLALLFFIGGTILVFDNSGKRYSGVMLVLFFWSLLSLLPTTLLLIEEHNHNFDNHNWILINYVNYLLVFIITALVMIPLAKRWHANAEQ